MKPSKLFKKTLNKYLKLVDHYDEDGGGYYDLDDILINWLCLIDSYKDKLKQFDYILLKCIEKDIDKGKIFFIKEGFIDDFSNVAFIFTYDNFENTTSTVVILKDSNFVTKAIKGYDPNLEKMSFYD